MNTDKLDARKWILPDRTTAGISSSDIPSVIKDILNVRGINSINESQTYLNPKLNTLSDPFEIPNMDAAVDRVLQAIDKKSPLSFTEITMLMESLL